MSVLICEGNLENGGSILLSIFQVLWLEEEKTIKDCVTDMVIGNKRINIKNLESFSDVSFKTTATESPEMRKKSFKDIFDTRGWGTAHNGRYSFKRKYESYRMCI